TTDGGVLMGLTVNDPADVPATSTEAPRCTLVVPTYNAASFISQTLTRLRAFVADHPHWCVLFMCDGCSDDTVARISAQLEPCFSSIALHSYEHNRGKGYALRRALSL